MHLSVDNVISFPLFLLYFKSFLYQLLKDDKSYSVCIIKSLNNSTKFITNWDDVEAKTMSRYIVWKSLNDLCFLLNNRPTQVQHDQ